MSTDMAKRLRPAVAERTADDKCVYCHKSRGCHKPGTFKCPVGRKTRVGYLYSDNVYTPSKKDFSARGVYEDAIRSTRRCANFPFIIKTWRQAVVGIVGVMVLPKDHKYLIGACQHFVDNWKTRDILSKLTPKQKKTLDSLFPMEEK